MERPQLKRVLEALLFVSEEPLPLDVLKNITGEDETRAVREVLDELEREYREGERSFGIRQVAGGFQIYTNPAYADWIKKLFGPRREAKLSVPALETLAIIAYRQPITRTEIEFIRGVNAEGVLSTLLERGLIRTMGRKDVVGRPIIYGTTRYFLKNFGLNSLDELPNWERFIEGQEDKNGAEKEEDERGEGPGAPEE